jgi:hypothetical protein
MAAACTLARAYRPTRFRSTLPATEQADRIGFNVDARQVAQVPKSGHKVVFASITQIYGGAECH